MKVKQIVGGVLVLIATTAFFVQPRICKETMVIETMLAVIVWGMGFQMMDI